MTRFTAFLSALALFSAGASTASVPYQPSSSKIHRISATCSSERVEIMYTIDGAAKTRGLNSISIDGVALPEGELAKARARTKGQRLGGMEFLGCRKTQQGDVRHWLLLMPAISHLNANDAGRDKSFYIRRGKVEIHERQPVD